MSIEMQKVADNILSARGILTSANAMGWELVQRRGGWYWKYPLFDLQGVIKGVHRLKGVTGHYDYAKYLWDGDTSLKSDWYFHPSIKPVHGALWLANGEPALLAMLASGIPNVICTLHTESKVPELGTLKTLGVSLVRIVPDKDETGYNSASTWKKTLEQNGIGCLVHSLPEIGEKADLNDLWIACKFDARKFLSVLNGLPLTLLPEPAETAQPKLRVVRPNFRGDFDWEALKRDVGGRLSPLGFKHDGWSKKPFPSPFREDKHPSCTYNVNSGVMKDMATGEVIKLTALADFFGFDRPKKGNR